MKNAHTDMEDPKQPYHYTAGDLERYVSGQMSRDEMHRLEKAALDDPFLAQALEGMMLSGGDEAWKDIGELKENLRIRIEGPQKATGPGPESSSPSAGSAAYTEPGVYPMRPSTETGASAHRIGWRNWRVAASIGLLIGLGAVTTWMLQRPTTADRSIASRINNPQTDTNPGQPEAASPAAPITAFTDTQAVAGSPAAGTSVPQPSTETKAASTASRNKDSVLTALTTVPATPVLEHGDITVAKAEPPVAQSEIKTGEGIIGSVQQNRARSVPAASGKITGPYLYTGQVKNPEGQPLSFVNIRLEPAGTSQYTDARGEFRILSADSNLTLQLNAYGYAKKSAQLQARQQNKPLTFTLQPSADRGKVKSALKPKASSREEMTTMDSEKSDTTGIAEAEPRDGWAAYHAYLLNNLRMPQDAALQKLHGTVDISFQVDAAGRLTDFRVEKSLSPSCDREAIRLVRDGPPWDLYNSDRPLRTRLTIVF